MTDFLPFCTYVISDNYHTPLLFPTYLPQAYSLLERYGQKDKILHPLFPKLFFFHWARGALPAGATLLGWPNSEVDGRSNKYYIDGQKHNLTMVSDASPGTATPKMNKSFIHMAHVSSDCACRQDGYLNRPHPTIIDGDMRWDSGWFLSGFGVGEHQKCN